MNNIIDQKIRRLNFNSIKKAQQQQLNLLMLTKLMHGLNTTK